MQHFITGDEPICSDCLAQKDRPNIETGESVHLCMVTFIGYIGWCLILFTLFTLNIELDIGLITPSYLTHTEKLDNGHLRELAYSRRYVRVATGNSYTANEENINPIPADVYYALFDVRLARLDFGSKPYSDTKEMKEAKVVVYF